MLIPNNTIAPNKTISDKIYIPHIF